METQMRTINFRGEDVTVSQAKSYISQIKDSIHALGPPAAPQYVGPAGDDLRQMLNLMLYDALQSLSRDNAPKSGRTSQFGVSISKRNWTLSLACHEGALHLHAKTEEYGLNEDDETAAVEVPTKVLDAVEAALTKGKGGGWRGRCWVSANRPNACPDSLREAYGRYIPFQSKGHDEFNKWFAEGLKGEYE